MQLNELIISRNRYNFEHQASPLGESVAGSRFLTRTSAR